MATRKPTLAHPYSWREPNSLWMVTEPRGVAAVAGAVVAALPERLTRVPGIESLLKRFGAAPIPRRLLLAALAALIGYVTAKGGDSVRTRALRALLSYQGWATNPASTRTKVWALLLRLFRGRQPFSTFKFQSLIPKQPLPDLDNSLDLWLQVAENLLSDEELDATREVVEDFRRNQGPQLQRHLIKKALTQDSWIYDYWLMGAYLSARSPLPIYSNYYVGHRHSNTDIDWLARGATLVHNMARLEQQLSSSKFSPILLQNLVPLCMHGFSYVFNCNRIPGEYMDEIVRYPGHSHLVVIRRGRYFKFDLYAKEGADGTRTLLSPIEIKIQLQRIVDAAQSLSEELPVAALTAQNRTLWAKHRAQLCNENEATVRDIDTAMFVVSLDDTTPKNLEEHAKLSLVGDGGNRWFDKCCTYAVMGGGWVGANVEHSAIDAMIFANTQEYVGVMERYDGNDVVKSRMPRDLPAPQPMEWRLNGLEDAIKTAKSDIQKLIDDIVVTVLQPSYGKRFMKKQRLSPDGYLQMVMQLAYFRMHGHIPKTYEPSTGRMFLLGRTETVHVASQHSRDWVRAMDDESSTTATRIDLLRKAIKYQSQYRLRATMGAGSDRHLMALLCASRELGMDLPAIFTDKLWQMPWLLSTSQTPNLMAEYGAEVALQTCSGGFGPAHQDGYGICYAIIGEDLLNFHITSWQSSSVADGARLAQHINRALEDVKKLFA